MTLYEEACLVRLGRAYWALWTDRSNTLEEFATVSAEARAAIAAYREFLGLPPEKPSSRRRKTGRDKHPGLRSLSRGEDTPVLAPTLQEGENNATAPEK